MTGTRFQKSPPSPAELERIVEKSLQKEREQRYQVIRDFMLNLKNLKLELEVEAELKRSISPLPREERRPKEQTPGRYTTDAMPATEDLDDRPQRTLEPVGGAVPLDSRFYIERGTDIEFHKAIERQASLVLVKGARQMGKSSLMVRTATRLREEGVGVAVLNLTAIGQNVNAEQWYGGLLSQLAQQLELDEELIEFWRANMALGRCNAGCKPCGASSCRATWVGGDLRGRN